MDFAENNESESYKEMSDLRIRPRQECTYALVSLGEVMIRLNPNEGRIRTARTFAISEGGGEYNVARGLKRCFGQRAAVVTRCDRRGSARCRIVRNVTCDHDEGQTPL